tara:strand:+ start:1314 stop:1799 length:486 start_codon:yes stop_codon:yes gene_type:complete
MKISLALLVLISSLFAQSMDREKMSDKRAEMLQDKKVFMIGAMTKDLDLSSEQAEKFFPLHNAFQKKSQDVKELHSKNLRKLREAARNDRSKFDVDAAINSKLKMQGALARLESKFLKDTKGILSEDQRIKLLFFEERMKSKMMDDRNSNKRNFDSKKKRN